MHAEQEFAWSGTLEVTNPASFGRLRIDDPIDLELGGESYRLMIDNKTIERDGVGMPRLTVGVISPAARLLTPRATPLERIWDTPVWARDAAEEAIGEAIQWDLVNWLITGGRLAVHDASPLDVVRTIATAAGGLVESLPDGTLRVRHRFPVAMPAWAMANVDHVLTDESDNLSCRESHLLRTRVNKVLVRDFLPSGAGFLSVEVDTRPDGLNHGRTSFFAGDTAHLLMHAGPDVVVADPLVSAGLILPGAWQTIPVTQDLLFNAVSTATLDKPAISIDSVIWIGMDLGALTLESDQRTVSVSKAGVAIARVTYRSMARSWAVSSPDQVAGLDEYPVQVHFAGSTGDAVGSGEIFCQRGDGVFRGPDISEPLLTTDDAKRSRGRAEIDAGEPLQEVFLTCLHRPGFMPGQLIEAHDALMGQSWRGKITSVSHMAQGNKLTTALELLRHVESTF
ncbi:MAG: hypothetical protein HQM03_11075 [Magnetococcales bacterium]|nr:hypothetical protein [Magnetococcales bacterium]